MHNGGNQTVFAVFLLQDAKKKGCPRNKKNTFFCVISLLQSRKTMLHYTRTCTTFLFLNRRKKKPEAPAQRGDAGIVLLQPHF
jgi:hypothetical protein